jgi:kynureninase
LHTKRKLLSGYLDFVLAAINHLSEENVLEVITPVNAEERGCQVSLLMSRNGRQVFNELTNHGVIADWREPNVIRIAPVPLYNSFEDIYQFGVLLEQVITEAAISN